jgi:predicted nucleic-acid-binding protein
VEKGAWVPLLALVEAIWVLGSVHELTSRDQAKAVEMLLNHHDLVLQDREIVVAALELFRGRPGLGFSDCLMLESARKAGHLPLGAFDRSLAKVEGTQKL